MFNDNSKIVIDFILILLSIFLFLTVIIAILIKYPVILFLMIAAYIFHIVDKIKKNKI